MNIEFTFDIGQSVKVKPIGMIGVVDSMSLDNNGKQYRVIYWNDSERHSVWMYEWEIEEIK
jgi:hypothetical protein